MSANWPSGLPSAPLIEGSSERYPELTIRTQTDIGPAKTRRRYTAGVEILQMRFVLSGSQMDIFDAFYFTTTFGGSLPFSMAHPRTGNTKDMRFLDVPVVTTIGNGYYELTFSVEVLI